jgi:hypothetical protein
MAPSGGVILLGLIILALAIALDIGLLILWSERRRRDRVGSAPSSGRAVRWVDSIARAIVGWGGSALIWLRRLVATTGQVLPRDELGRLRTFLVVGALLLNASIGYAYAARILVESWPLWTWLLSVGLASLCLFPLERVPTLRPRDVLVALGLVLGAAIVRVLSLETVPPGLHGDESRMAQITLHYVFAGPDTLNPFRSGLYSQPALYHYVLWISMRLFGETIGGLRAANSIAGSLAVAATYLAVAQVSGRRPALFAGLMLIGYHYHIHWSRLALNNIWDTLWIPAMIGLFLWGWERRWSGGAVLAGVAMGLSQYFYAGSRIGVLLLAFIWIALLRRGSDLRLWVIHVGKALVAAGVVAAPLAMFAVRQPVSFFDRFLEVLFWRPGIGPGLDPARLSWLEAIVDQSLRAVAGFTSMIETTGFYRPNVPLVMGIAAPLFLAAILWAVYRREYLPVVWLGLTMFFGGFLLTGTPGSSHYVAAIPAVVWLVALLIDGLGRSIRPWLAWALLLAVVATDLYYYFGLYTPFVAPDADLNLPFPSSSP